MPITPLHFGINGFIANLNRKNLDISSAILANILLDIQPFLALILDWKIPVHGISHTLIGGGIICLFSAIIYTFVMNFFSRCPKSFLIYLNSWLLGGFLHLILDSMVHQDVKIFYPFANISFSNHFTNITALIICVIGYVFWLIMLKLE